MIDKLTTKVSINTQGEAIRFANECYEVADEFAIGFAEWIFTNGRETIRKANEDGLKSTKELLEIYKKTL